MSPVWLKHMYSVLWALRWRPISAAARSKLCSSVSAWLGVFAKIKKYRGVKSRELFHKELYRHYYSFQQYRLPQRCPHPDTFSSNHMVLTYRSCLWEENYMDTLKNKLETFQMIGLISWHINHCWLSNAKFYFYIYIKYIISKHTVKWSNSSLSKNSS